MNVAIYKPLCNLVWLLRIWEFHMDINSLWRRTDLQRLVLVFLLKSSSVLTAVSSSH